MVDISYSDGLSQIQREAAQRSIAFRNWIARLAADFDLRSVLIRDVVMFGSNAGFILADADVRSPEGIRLPGVAFLRGASVGILPILVAPNDERYAVLVRQSRVASANKDFYEIPAGMLDDGDFRSKALEELNEEIGSDLVIDPDALVQLYQGHTSPGGSDEELRTYSVEIPIGDDIVERLRNRRAGNIEHGEIINVEVVPLDDVPRLASSDMKTMLAYHMYSDKLEPRLVKEVGDTQPFTP